MTTQDAGNVLWLDFETTGFMTSPDTVPLEVAMIVTDADLNELESYGPVAIDAKGDDFEHAFSAMDDFVHNMHTTTGLLQRIEADGGVPIATVDAQMAQIAEKYFPTKGDVINGHRYRGGVIGGNSVKFDFDVIEKFFPQTLARIDYRVIDISSMGELVKRWYPQAWDAMPKKLSDHTAMTDIREGIKELRYYREVLRVNS